MGGMAIELERHITMYPESGRDFWCMYSVETLKHLLSSWSRGGWAHRHWVAVF